MGIASAIHERLPPGSPCEASANSCQRAVQKKAEDYFEFTDAAGMGFFGIVFYALRV